MHVTKRRVTALVPKPRPPYLWSMRGFIICLCAALPAAAAPAVAQTRPSHLPAHPAGHAAPAAPRAIGKFEDWTAATHQEAGQTVCYAFTRAIASTPPLQGRGDVVLTVTERPGGARDAVALSAGFAYPASAEVNLTVEGTTVPFYTSQRSAFARDGRAVVALFERGQKAVMKSPAPRNGTVTDTFLLRGFSPAFAAINKACFGKG